MLKSLFRKLAGLKEKVQKGSKFDKLNLADDVKARSPLVKSVVDRNARIFSKQVMRTDLSVMPEDVDTNQSAMLTIQGLVFTSKAQNPAANLITIEIKAGAAEAINVRKNSIQITTEDGVSDHTLVKALIDGKATAIALVSVEIEAGEDATLVDASPIQPMSGALG